MTDLLLAFFSRPQKLEYAVRHFSATWKPTVVFEKLLELEQAELVVWREADRTFVAVGQED